MDPRRTVANDDDERNAKGRGRLMAVDVLDCLTVGPLQSNCYLVGDPASGHAVCVDPGDEAPRIISRAAALGIAPRAVLITHAHADHILAAPEVARAWGAPVLAPDGEQELWALASEFLAAWGIHAPQPDPPDRWIRPGEDLIFGGLTLRTLDVRGHSPAGLAFHVAPLVFVGDALFAGSIGRTDLPGQDHRTLVDRIRTELLSLPPNTRVFPGHGPETTVEREREHNPFLVTWERGHGR